MLWQQALTQTLKEWQGRSVVFGQTDCCQMAARYVQLLTGGENLAEKFFSYNGHRDAESIIDAASGLVGVVRTCLGPETESEIKPGDIAVVDVGDDETVGIYNGAYFFTVEVKRGEVMRCAADLSRVAAHWSVA